MITIHLGNLSNPSHNPTNVNVGDSSKVIWIHPLGTMNLCKKCLAIHRIDVERFRISQNFHLLVTKLGKIGFNLVHTMNVCTICHSTQ